MTTIPVLTHRELIVLLHAHRVAIEQPDTVKCACGFVAIGPQAKLLWSEHLWEHMNDGETMNPETGI